MSRPSQVIVVLEDEHHKMLLYRYLKMNRLQTVATFRISPRARGSAESWVRTTFSREVSAYRMRRARAATVLIVMIDADTHTVQDRLAQLDQVLRDEKKPVVDPGSEQIARLVPRRNVETWVLCLNEEAVDEETNYKGNAREWSRLIPPAATALSAWVRQQAEMPILCVDSLRAGVGELKRLGL